MSLERIRLFFYLLPTLTFAQTDFQPYSQKINGTALSFELLPVSGGSFVMGNKQGQPDAQPEHKVEVSPFWMSKFEVSWDLFEPFVYKELEKSQSTALSAEVDAITRPSKPYLDMTFGIGKQGYPALAMTQYNAIQFCKWLYARTGVFYRLPTEAEWEYAAKMGQNEGPLETYAWTTKNAKQSTQKVGTLQANKFGIHDLIGNVAEWTYDQYSPDFYAETAKSNGLNPVNEPVKLYPHVVRGGSYQSDANYLSPTARDYSDPSWKQIDPQVPKSNWWMPDAPFVGIRLVRPVKTPTAEEIAKYFDKTPIKDY
jgi:sulfatase modifying factor 1